MKRLTVLYDGTCGFCVECARWLQAQRQIVRLELVASSSLVARAHFPTLVGPSGAEELVVVDDQGGVYRGTHAWIMCLWALREYRAAAIRLARPSLLPLARAAFALISRSRQPLSRWLDLAPEAEVASAAGQASAPACDTKGACR